MQISFPTERLLSNRHLAHRVRTGQDKLVAWLSTGMAPRQLAFTLALGFAIGCIPLLGVTTGICAVLALALGLNMPAIQAANWLAMPFQVLLLVPFLKLGQWLFPGHAVVLDRSRLIAQLTDAPWRALMQMGGVFGHGLIAWLMTAVPAALVLTLLLTPLMRLLSTRSAVSAR